MKNFLSNAIVDIELKTNISRQFHAIGDPRFCNVNSRSFFVGNAVCDDLVDFETESWYQWYQPTAFCQMFLTVYKIDFNLLLGSVLKCMR